MARETDNAGMIYEAYPTLVHSAELLDELTVEYAQRDLQALDPADCRRLQDLADELEELVYALQADLRGDARD